MSFRGKTKYYFASVIILTMKSGIVFVVDMNGTTDLHRDITTLSFLFKVVLYFYIYIFRF